MWMAGEAEVGCLDGEGGCMYGCMDGCGDGEAKCRMEFC